MDTSVEQNWFTERDGLSGSAFSLEITDRIHDEQSSLQRIEVYETRTFGRLLTLDGVIMLSDRDQFIYHEMIAQPALCMHPQPNHVAIIGGGDCGTLQQVALHDRVQHIDLVEIDERVVRVSERFFSYLCTANTDPRVHMHFSDGIAWCEQQAESSLDVILVDSTDPVGPAEGLFREPFFRSVHRSLKPQGLMVQQSESPLLHQDIILQMHKRLRSVGFSDVKTLLFPLCVYPSGWWSATIAAKDGVIPVTPLIIPDFPFHYYNNDIHQAAFALPAFLRRILEQADPEPKSG